MTEPPPASALTLEQRAALVVGAGFWATADAAADGIPSIAVSDGPHGLRMVIDGGGESGTGETAPATCFPPAAGLASSWNPHLVERVGAAIGAEARQHGVGVVLGPGVNIKRSPLCGRNFEYYSEDPLLSGELGAAWVRGVQSQGVGASLKHFAVNNQETMRMTVSAEVDERTLRELYLPAFERIVTREQPWTVMCAYNRVNGVHAAEHRWLLTEVLREQWGFDGAVISDWGAVVDLQRSIAAGLDLEMPGPQPDAVADLAAAVRAGALDEAALDRAVDRIRALGERVTRATSREPRRDHAVLARDAAAESIVLLRNQDELLPLSTSHRIAVIGELARSPRIQGAGSSQVVPTRVVTPLEAITSVAPIEFVPGYRLDRAAPDAELLAEAVAVAERSDAVLLFVGLPEAEESEGFDRTHLDLPPAHAQLIGAVVAANPRTAVVLVNGGVVSLEPWHDSAAAILETWLLGQEGGAAIADVVFGKVAPSGRLAESIPLRLEDTPSFLNFPGERDVVRYGEGVFVGYRYYDTAAVPVRYPFGFGLTYTTFDYANLDVSRDGSRVSFTVTNTGDRDGRDVPQVYVSSPGDGLAVPARELRSFAKVSLGPGESIRVELSLDERAFQHWDPAVHGWVTAAGEHLVQLGRSSADIVLSAAVTMAPRRTRLTLDSRVDEFLAHPVTGPFFARASSSEGGTDVLAMVGSMPVRRLARFPGAADSLRHLGLLIALANTPIVRAIAGWWARRRARR